MPPRLFFRITALSNVNADGTLKAPSLFRTVSFRPTKELKVRKGEGGETRYESAVNVQPREHHLLRNDGWYYIISKKEQENG